MINKNQFSIISSVIALSLSVGLLCSSHQPARALSKDGLGNIKDNAVVYRRQALDYLAQHNDALCLEFFQKAIDQAGKDMGPNSSYVSDLYFEMGTVAKERAKLSTAEHCFQESLKHRPNSIPARLMLAQVYFAQGKRNEAFAQIKSAKTKNPRSPQAQMALVCYIQGLNRPAEAAREASLIQGMLPNSAKGGKGGKSPAMQSNFAGLTELHLNAPAVTQAKPAAAEKTEKIERTQKSEVVKATPVTPPEKSVSNENHIPPNVASSSSVLKGLMHGTVNQPSVVAPVVTPITAAPPPTPKVDDKELELAKAKAQVEMMRKQLEAAKHGQVEAAKKTAHEITKHSETTHKKHADEVKPKHAAKPHEDAATDVGERAAVLHTKAVIEGKKKPGGFANVQSNVPSDKSSSDSSHADDGGNVVKPKTSDLRVTPPDDGVIAPQYRPMQNIPAAKKPKGHGTTMVPPPPPTPVFSGVMPLMQVPQPVQQIKPKQVKPKPQPKPVEDNAPPKASPKTDDGDPGFLLEWGGSNDKHKHAKAKEKEKEKSDAEN